MILTVTDTTALSGSDSLSVTVKSAAPGPICASLAQPVNYVDTGYAPPCSGISPVSSTLKIVDSHCNPIVNARVNLRKANGGYVTYARTNADGLASFDVVPGGELKLEAKYHGDTYATAVSTSHAQETVQTLPFSLRLTDSTGQPIEDARVNLRKASGGYVTYTRTGVDGVASFQVVPDAQMRLEVDYHGATCATPTTEVTEDTQLEVQTVVLTVHLTVQGADLANQRVDLLESSSAYVTYTRTGSDGQTLFEALPDAEHKLRSTCDGDMWVSDSVVGPAEVEHDFD